LKKKPSSLFLFCFFLNACTNRADNNLLNVYLKDLKKIEKGAGSSLDLIKTYKRIISIAPNTKHSDKAIIKIADIYYSAGIYKEAIKYYKLYIDLVKLSNQKIWETNNIIADIYFSRYANYEKALEYYTQAMNAAYDNKQIFLSSYYVGKTQFFLFNFESALKSLKKAYTEYKEAYVDKLIYQELLYYFSYTEFLFLKETKDSYTASGFGYLDQSDIDSIIKNIDTCIEIDVYAKYGVLCKYFKADLYIEHDLKDKALDLLKELRGTYPNPDLIEFKISNLEK